LTTYLDCTLCDDAGFGLALDATYFYCTNYCPTGFTETGGKPACAVPAGDRLIYTGKLNNFNSAWADAGITATAKPAVTVSAGVKPAFERG
jgi:hypothetical protein